MKIGQQVYLRISTEEPKAQGTVSALGHDGSFRVTYRDNGGRYWYPATSRRNFVAL